MEGLPGLELVDSDLADRAKRESFVISEAEARLSW
jgi:hypothetical protein